MDRPGIYVLQGEGSANVTLPAEGTWARIRRAAADARRSRRWLPRGKRPRAPPGVICPHLKTPWGARFRCFVHRDPQALADNDWKCRKLCLPRGGPFKQTIRPRGIPTGGRLPMDLRGLGIDANRRPSRPSPGQLPPHPLRQRVFGRRVA